MKISCPVCSRELDTVEADYIPGHQNNNTLMPCIGGDRTLAESKASLKTLKAMRKAAKLAKTGIGGELARVSGTATGRSRLTVYQLEAKQTVAEYFGLSFDQVDLPYDEWAALREKYTKESGKQL